MDLVKIITELQDEKKRLDEAIEALERLSLGTPKRRGRPSLGAQDISMGSANVEPVTAARVRKSTQS